MMIGIIFIIGLNLITADTSPSLNLILNPSIPSVSISYTWNITTDNDCEGGNVVFSKSEIITTNTRGFGFVSLNISNLTDIDNLPTRLCEFRDNILRANLSYSDMLLNSLRVKQLYTNFGNFTDLHSNGINLSDVNNIFLRQNGSTPLTGNWDVGSFNITNIDSGFFLNVNTTFINATNISISFLKSQNGNIIVKNNLDFDGKNNITNIEKLTIDVMTIDNGKFLNLGAILLESSFLGNIVLNSTVQDENISFSVNDGGTTRILTLDGSDFSWSSSTNIIRHQSDIFPSGSVDIGANAQGDLFENIIGDNVHGVTKVETNLLSFTGASSEIVNNNGAIKYTTIEGDHVFDVDDGGGVFTALTIDGFTGILELLNGIDLLDNKKIRWGTGGDATCQYTGSHMECNPKAVGSGQWRNLGEFNATEIINTGQNFSVGGMQGLTQAFNMTNSSGDSCFLNFTGGILTSGTC